MSTAMVSIPIPSDVVKHVKVTLNDDTRRFSVNDDATKFAQLVKNVRDVYALPANATLLFKYKDEDGDLISVSSEPELNEAFRVAGAAALRLTVTSTIPKAAAKPAAVKAAEPVAVKAAEPAVAKSPAKVAEPAAKPAAVKAAEAKPAAAKAPAVAKAAPAPAPAPTPAVAKAPAPTPSTAPIAMIRLVPTEGAPTATTATTAPTAAAAAPVKKPQVEVLKERNQALQERLEQFKQRMHQLKAAREAGVLQVQTLQRDLHYLRAEKNPKCKAVLARGRFVSDVTIPDGTTLTPGQVITKTWRFRNDAQEAWPCGSRLLFVGRNSDRMGAPDEVLVEREVLPGQEIDISVPLTAPAAPGRYVTYFRLCDGQQRKFGQRVWCSVLVKESNSSSSDEEEANPAPPKDADLVKYQHQLQLLAEMNQTNLRLNLRLLTKFNGDIEKVVERLFARKAKFAARLAANPQAADKMAARLECKAARLEAKIECKAAKLEAKIAAKVEKKTQKDEKLCVNE